MIKYIVNTKSIKLVKATNGYIITFHDKNINENSTLVFETMENVLEWISDNMIV